MLKRQEGYLLKHIHKKIYLLPFGQNIADQKRGILLNETGEFLGMHWKLLRNYHPWRHNLHLTIS